MHDLILAATLIAAFVALIFTVMWILVPFFIYGIWRQSHEHRRLLSSINAELRWQRHRGIVD